MEKEYLSEDLFYQRPHGVKKICEPISKIPYPINRYLFELFDEKSAINKGEVDFKQWMANHKQTHDFVETCLLRQHRHEEMVYENAPKKIQANMDKPDESITEFYTYVKISPELKEYIAKNGLVFNEYLLSLAYIGQGKKNETRLSSSFAAEIENHPDNYLKVTNEQNVYHLLDKAKEFATLLVYNYINLWNLKMKSLPFPTEMICTKPDGSTDSQLLFEQFSSFGIYTLYQNYLILLDQLYKHAPKKSIQIRDENIERQKRKAIQLSECESKKILILDIQRLIASVERDFSGGIKKKGKKQRVCITEWLCTLFGKKGVSDSEGKKSAKKLGVMINHVRGSLKHNDYLQDLQYEILIDLESFVRTCKINRFEISLS